MGPDPILRRGIEREEEIMEDPSFVDQVLKIASPRGIAISQQAPAFGRMFSFPHCGAPGEDPCLSAHSPFIQCGA